MSTIDLGTVPLVASLLDVLCGMTGMGLALVTRMTGDQWTTCAIRDEINTEITSGLTLPASTMLCREVTGGRQLLVVSDLAEDPVHCSDPFLVQQCFRSYIGAPIRLADGSVFGTLCTFGREVIRVDNIPVESVFGLFAKLVANQIDAADRIAATSADLRTATSRLDVSETGRQAVESQLAVSTASLNAVNTRLTASDAALLNAQATGLLREQFVAVLGHDLRNPISAIAAGTRLLQRQPLDDRGRQVLAMMGQSADRMAELVRNMLDFALTQFGGGIPVHCTTTSDLASTLGHVVGELQAKFPDRDVVTRLELDLPVSCDPNRIGQLLSNLLANAITHGAADQPVWVNAATKNGMFELAVSNGGRQVSTETMAGLFKPFVKGNRHNQEGLGLGLHIAAAIAHAHGGTLVATSTQESTKFVLCMPNGIQAACSCK